MFITQSPLWLYGEPILILLVPFLYGIVLIFSSPKEARRRLSFVAFSIFLAVSVVIFAVKIFPTINGHFELLIPRYFWLIIYSADAVFYKTFLQTVGVGGAILGGIAVRYFFYKSELPTPPLLRYFAVSAAVLGGIVICFFIALSLWVLQIKTVSLPDFESIVAQLTPPDEYTPAQKEEIQASKGFASFLKSKFPITTQQGEGPVYSYRTLAEYAAASPQDMQYFVDGNLSAYIHEFDPLTASQKAELDAFRKQFTDEFEKQTQPIFENALVFLRTYGLNDSISRASFIGSITGSGYMSPSVHDFILQSKGCVGNSILLVVPSCIYFAPQETVVFRPAS